MNALRLGSASLYSYIGKLQSSKVIACSSTTAAPRIESKLAWCEASGFEANAKHF